MSAEIVGEAEPSKVNQLAGRLSITSIEPRADDAANAWKALRSGGHVALMRHTDAPGGAGDPPGFRIDDCATQRNLSEKGRADAEKIGSRLKREGIAFEKILSSPWCRCIDTAKLLNLRTVETEATFGNVVVLRDQRETLTAGARALIAKWTAHGNLLIVTHGAGVKFFLDDLTDTPWANDKIDPDLYKRFTGLTKFGVEAYLCEITFKRNNIDLAKAKKDSFLKFVPSGVAAAAELQSKGFAYLKVG